MVEPARSSPGMLSGDRHLRWQERLPGILNDLRVGLIVGSEHYIQYASDAVCDLTGYSHEELAGLSLVDLLPPRARDGFPASLQRRVDDGAENGRFEADLLHRDGNLVPVEVAVDFMEVEGRTEVIATLRDLSDRRTAEVEAATRARQQAAVAELGRMALLGADFSTLVDAAAELVARTLGVEYVEVLELLPDRAALLMRAGVGWADGLLERATVGAGRASQAGFTLEADEPVVAGDLGGEARFRTDRILAGHGVRSAVTVVIRGNDAPYGVLGAGTTRPRAFGEDDVHFLRAVANVVANAAARVRAEAKLAGRARQEEAVVSLGRQALVQRDVGPLLIASVDLVARTLDVEPVMLLQLVPGGLELRLRAGAGCRPGCVGVATWPAEPGSQARYTLAADTPVVCENLTLDDRFRPAPLLVEHGVVSTMSVVVGAGRPWGALIACTTERRVFSADEARFLQSVAHVLAVTIQRAEFDQELRTAHDNERRLRRRVEMYARHAVNAQEAERLHLARELHDEIGQVLTGLMFTLENAERLPAAGLGQRLDRARVLVGELLQRVRDLSLDLRPVVLDDLGLAAALLSLVERFTAQTGVQVRIAQLGLGRRFPPEVETAAYRIAQEALTNVARHSASRRATLRCVAHPDGLVVEVGDDGAGFDVEAARAGSGSGLVGMEERARATGGRLRVHSVPGRGTTIVAELAVRPLDDERP